MSDKKAKVSPAAMAPFLGDGFPGDIVQSLSHPVLDAVRCATKTMAPGTLQLVAVCPLYGIFWWFRGRAGGVDPTLVGVAHVWSTLIGWRSAEGILYTGIAAVLALRESNRWRPYIIAAAGPESCSAFRDWQIASPDAIVDLDSTWNERTHVFDIAATNWRNAGLQAARELLQLRDELSARFRQIGPTVPSQVRRALRGGRLDRSLATSVAVYRGRPLEESRRS